MNFRMAARIIEADLTSDLSMTTDWPSDRPTTAQPPVQTDALDPAALGGPAPMNGFGPLGDKVVSDPLLPVPYRDNGGAIPHLKGPDLDTTTLPRVDKNWGNTSGSGNTGA